MDHPHLHCIVSGGGLSEGKWISSKRRFLFPVKVMSRLFRGKFLAFLKKAYEEQHLEIAGKDFTSFLQRPLREGVGGLLPSLPSTGLRPSSAISGGIPTGSRSRTTASSAWRDGKVSFLWKDYADGNKQKVMTLDAFRVHQEVPPPRPPRRVREDTPLRVLEQQAPEGVSRGLPHAPRGEGAGTGTIRDVAGVSLEDHRDRCDPVSGLRGEDEEERSSTGGRHEGRQGCEENARSRCRF